jgi:hypothetical protein
MNDRQKTRLWLALAPFCVLVATAGCGGSATSAALPAVTMSPTYIAHAKTYADASFGFSLTYDDSKLLPGPWPRPKTVEGVTFGFFADNSSYRSDRSIDGLVDRSPKDRFGLNNSALGGLGISAFRASRTVAQPSVSALRRARRLFWVGNTRGGAGTGSIKAVVVNGLSGFSSSWRWNGERATWYFLFQGRYMYFFSCTASIKAWPGISPAFDSAVSSLRTTQ